MKKKYVLLCLSLMLFGSVFSQHYSLYSQYMFNGLIINPAFAGSTKAIDLTVSHRRQWTGLAMSPITTALTLHAPVKTDKISLGFSLSDDRVGVTTQQNLNAVYAYHLKLGESSLSFGLQGGIEFGRANWDKLIRNDAQDDLLLSTSPNTMNFTGGAGTYYQSKNIVAGLSLPYLLNTGSYKNFMSGPFLLYGGYNFFLSDSSVIKPSLLVRGVGGSPTQFDLNVMYSWKQKYGFGISYRNQESLIALLEINFMKQFRLCYSYDYGVGETKNFHNGSHEITFRYLFSKGAGEQKQEPKETSAPINQTEEKK